jgi:nucleotide-binding universal stress UspA family protein
MTARRQRSERSKEMNKNGNAGVRGVVVVGIDGSAGASAALRWAAAEARLRKSRLLIVHAWRPAPTDLLLGGPLGGFSGGGASDTQRAAEELLQQATAGLEAEGIEFERRVVAGGAPEVLVDAADQGDLLVVGSRGHGGFAGLLLGSVSQQCAHHARGPVVIVHAPTLAAGGSELTAAATPASQATA